MEIPHEAQAVQDVVTRLAELLDYPTTAIHPQLEVKTADQWSVDGLARLGPYTFVIEWKSSGGAAPVLQAIKHVIRGRDGVGAYAIPLVAVPYMGHIGRRACMEKDVAWLDLSGNAWIVAPGLRIFVHGEPNRFRHRGRLSSAFAPRSSRIARWLLVHPDKAPRQHELADAVGISRGLTSRVVARLLNDGLVGRDSGGGIRVRDRGALLDAWHEVYAFDRQAIVRGHVSARSGDELLTRVGAALQARSAAYAATGLGAAWLYTRFAIFRTATFYVTESIASLAQDLGFRDGPRGANVWLVRPRDPGVFEGATDRDGVRCVHPVQVYLDLKGHPERAKEAAERLRSEFLDEFSDA